MLNHFARAAADHHREIVREAGARIARLQLLQN
jgi:hypothetical protein